MDHILHSIQRSLGRLEGKHDLALTRLGEHSRLLWRLGEKVAKLEQRQQASPSPTPTTSWHHIIALAIAMVAGTLMNIAPKELAQILLAFGR